MREQSLCHPELDSGSQTETSYSPITLFPRPLKRAFTLAEVLITLGIIGVVAAMTLPGVIQNFERTKNAAILKRAYSDLQAYVLDFVRENCGLSNIGDCCPNDGEFVIEFQNYLYSKQKFHLMNPDKSSNSWFAFQLSDGTRRNIGLSYPFETATGGHGRYLGSPTGLYAFFISVFMRDNYYNIRGDKFRARILIVTDMGSPGILRPYSYIEAEPHRKIPKVGKNVFEAFVLDSGKVIPNGTDKCANIAGSWAYYCKSLEEMPCMTRDVTGSTTCLSQVILDGWKIKYDY